MAAQAAVRRCPARCAGSPCRAPAAPFPCRGRSRRLCSLSPAVRRPRREALTSAQLRPALRPAAARMPKGEVRQAQRIIRRMVQRVWLGGAKSPAGAVRSWHAKYVPKPSAGVVHRLYLRGSADHRVRLARSFARRPLYRSLPNRITTFHPIGPGRRPAHGWRRIYLPPGSHGMLLVSVRVSSADGDPRTGKQMVGLRPRL